MFLVFLRFNFCTFTVVNELPNIDCEWLFFGPDYSTSTTRPPTTHLDSVECREESIGGTFIEIRDRYEKLSPKNLFLQGGGLFFGDPVIVLNTIISRMEGDFPSHLISYGRGGFAVPSLPHRAPPLPYSQASPLPHSVFRLIWEGMKWKLNHENFYMSLLVPFNFHSFPSHIRLLPSHILWLLPTHIR